VRLPSNEEEEEEEEDDSACLFGESNGKILAKGRIDR